jgi:hypothetical protein
VEEQKEEELKLKIAEFYSKYHEEPSVDRQKVLGQIYDLVYKWCRRYIFYKKTEKMGVEIVNAVKRCVERVKMPPEEFLKYLGTALYNARNEYYRNDIEDSVKETTLNKELKELIKMWESEANKKLEQHELIILISEWKCISEKKARAYLDGKIISDTADDNKKKLDKIKSFYPNPENEAIENNTAEILKKALETVLNEYHEKTEPFYRALFTIRFIKNNKNYERFRPILDAEILEIYEQNGKIPAQYEIYMKYHPNAEKSTAETNASQMSKKFYADINKAIKEKDPEFIF